MVNKVKFQALLNHPKAFQKSELATFGQSFSVTGHPQIVEVESLVKFSLVATNRMGTR
jgi:hypothetical protein